MLLVTFGELASERDRDRYRCKAVTDPTVGREAIPARQNNESLLVYIKKQEKKEGLERSDEWQVVKQAVQRALN